MRSRNPKGTVGRALAFLFPRKVSERVMYPRPIGEFDNAMDKGTDRSDEMKLPAPREPRRRAMSSGVRPRLQS